MKHNIKRAVALLIALLLATLSPVAALAEGLEPPVPEAGVIQLSGEPDAGASNPSTVQEGDSVAASADGTSQGDPNPAPADGTSQDAPDTASNPVDAEGGALSDDENGPDLPPEEVDLQLGQAVKVVFAVSPADAALTVRPENSEEAVAPEYDGSFLLPPGEYVYSAGADGYASLEAEPFTVTGDEQPLCISVALKSSTTDEAPAPLMLTPPKRALLGTTANGMPVSFVDTLDWGNLYVYYWPNGAEYPGVGMTQSGTNDFGQAIYTATVPYGTEGIIFSSYVRETVDITEGIEYGAMWYASDTTDGRGRYEVGKVEGSGDSGDSGGTVSEKTGIRYIAVPEEGGIIKEVPIGIATISFRNILLSSAFNPVANSGYGLKKLVYKFGNGEENNAVYDTATGLYKFLDSQIPENVVPVTVKAYFDPAYTITVPTGLTGGTVEADKAEAIEGESVTLTISPESGYALESLTVNGASVIDEVVENKYTFQMSAENVTVNASFASASEPEDDPLSAFEYLTVVGSSHGNFLHEEFWDLSSEQNRMEETETGIYRITYENIEPLSYDYLQFKFAVNGSWSDNFGYSGGDVDAGVWYDAEYNGGNIQFAYPTEADSFNVTLKLDLTGYDPVTKEGAKFQIVAWDSGTDEPEPSDPLTSQEFTVYFVDTLGWGDLHVHYWGGDSVSGWPDVEMTQSGTNDSGKAIYTATVPCDIEGLLFHGNDKFTVEITVGIEDGAMWYALDDKGDQNHYKVAEGSGDSGDSGGTVSDITGIRYIAVPEEGGTVGEVPFAGSATGSFPLGYVAFNAVANSGYCLNKVVYQFDNAEEGNAYYDTGAGHYRFLGNEIPSDFDSVTIKAYFVPAGDEPDPVEPGGSAPSTSQGFTVYFTDNREWGTVYAAFWNAEGAPKLPGCQMTWYDTNDFEENIYAITIPGDTVGIVFNNGNGERTVAITEDIKAGAGWYIYGETDAPGCYDVRGYTIEVSGADEPDPIEPGVSDPPTPQELTVYFINNQMWPFVFVRCYDSITGQYDPGQEMTYIGKNNEQMQIYRSTIPYDTERIIFYYDDNLQTVEIFPEGIEDGQMWWTSGESDESGSYIVDCGSFTPDSLISYDVDITAENGRVEADSTSAHEFDTVTLSVFPDEGFELESLSVNDTDVTAAVVDNTYTFAMPEGGANVSATFKQVAYTVSVFKNELISQTFTVNGQAVTPTDGDGNNMTLQIPAGAEVSITATPVDSSEHRIEDIQIFREDNGDHFGTVTDGENGARTATFIMPEARVNVSILVVEAGYQVDTGVQVYDGENVIFKVTATPDRGEEGTPITLTVEKADDVTLDSMAYVSYDEAAGGEITTTLTPDASGKYTFNMPDSSVRVEPKYRLTREHQIINKLGDGPSVCLVFQRDEYDPNLVETTTANAGDKVRVYPNGATLTDFKVNGTAVEASGEEWDPYYEFTMPDGDATLTGSVTYSLQTYWFEHGKLTVQVGDGEAIEMNGDTPLSVPAGAQVTVTATPDAGYKLYRLSYMMGGSDVKSDVEIQSGVPFTMPGDNIVIVVEFNTPWNHLRNQIDSARYGDTITLTEDAIAPAGEGHVGIWDKAITIDLNGHTIDRHLSEPTDNGCVIYVDSGAALTLVDSAGGGKITGGNNYYIGGGIAVAGTLNLQGGAITGNSASDGGGVAVFNSGAVFNLTGGEITGNANTSERSSAGVYYTSGTMNVFGSPVVTDAVYVDWNCKLHVTGALTNADPIPVIITEGVGLPFTAGLQNNGGAANFKSADENYRVRVNDVGEAELYEPTFHTVTFNGLYENGDFYSITQRVAEGETAAWPEQGTVQDDQVIVGWYQNGTEFDFDTPIAEDIVLEAMWQPAYPITLDVKGSGTLSVDTNNDGIPEQVNDSAQVLAAAGKNVAVTITPAAKHIPVYDEGTDCLVTFTDGDGEPVRVDMVSFDPYTFVMPYSPVTVSAEFVEAEYYIYINYTSDSGFYTYSDSIAVTVDGEPAQGVVYGNPVANPDQAVALDVTPAAGYALVEITGEYFDWKGQYYPLDISQSATEPNHWTFTFTMPDGWPKLIASFHKLPAATFMDGETVCATQYADPATGLLTRPADPTKEGHRFLGWYADGAAEAFDFNTPITADITLTARWAEPVTLTATMRDANGNSVSGSVTLPEGDVYPGDEVTLTAPRASGYNFTGWFAEGGAENLCRDLGYTFTVGDVTNFVAKYKKLESVEIIINGGNSFTINGKNKSGEITDEYVIGTEITVATGDAQFDYWRNASGAVLSRDSSYTFVATGKDSITAVFKTYVEGQATLIFESYYHQILRRNQYASGNEVNPPALPERNGYNTLGWDYNGDGVFDANDTTDEAVRLGLEAPNNALTIYAVYELIERTYTIEVINGTGGGTYQQNDKVTVKANTPEAGKKFSHWEDEGGNKVHYNVSYPFFVDRNIKLTAVYVDDAVIVEAVGTTSIIEATKDTDSDKMRFVSLSSVPEGCVIQKAGLIATNDATVGTSGDGFNAGTARSIKADAWNGTTYRYTWTISGMGTGSTVYVRAYLVYTDLNGNTCTIYGDMVSLTM